MNESANRLALIRAASSLFRRRGYAGVGLSEILAATGLPKGSLYYHFPEGKSQLAAEATRWAGEQVTALIDASFEAAAGFAAGAAALSRAVAGLAAGGVGFGGCPVLSVIQAGGEKPGLRRIGAEVMAGWIGRIALHARRLGQDAPDDAAEMLVMQIQGAWVVALVRQSTDPFDTLARHLAGVA